MPTGYTTHISKGISFRTFVLHCARAFGACIDLRDSNRPIPKEFKPPTFSQRQLLYYGRFLSRLTKMSARECQKRAKAEYEWHVKYHTKRIRRIASLKRKYEAMLAKVEAWSPPSGEHKELKAFMQEQITGSIKFDCGGTHHQDELKNLRMMTGAEWRKSKIASTLQSIADNAQSQIKDNDRAARNTLWVRQLQESLGGAKKRKSR